MVGVGNVEADDVASVSVVDFLLSNDLGALYTEGSLQEGHFAVPQCGSHPVVSLIVEESKVGDFLRAKIDHVFDSLVEQKRASAQIVQLNVPTLESHGNDALIWTHLNSLDLVALFEVGEVVIEVALVTWRLGLLKGVRPDAKTTR